MNFSEFILIGKIKDYTYIVDDEEGYVILEVIRPYKTTMAKYEKDRIKVWLNQYIWHYVYELGKNKVLFVKGEIITRNGEITLMGHTIMKG